MSYWIRALLAAAFHTTLAGVGQCADIPLNVGEVRTVIIGRDVEQGDMLFNFDPDGSYSTTNGASGGLGRYSLGSDGRVCWTRGDGASGCFLYYRRGSELRVRRADSLSQFDIGPAVVQDASSRTNSAQVAEATTETATSTTPPYGKWVFLYNDACDTMGQYVEISPNRIVIDFAGELATYTGVFVEGCEEDICTFRQTTGNGSWSTRQLSATRIIFRGPHGSAGSERSRMQRADLCS